MTTKPFKELLEELLNNFLDRISISLTGEDLIEELAEFDTDIIDDYTEFFYENSCDCEDYYSCMDIDYPVSPFSEPERFVEFMIYDGMKLTLLECICMDKEYTKADYEKLKVSISKLLHFEFHRVFN